MSGIAFAIDIMWEGIDLIADQISCRCAAEIGGGIGTQEIGLAADERFDAVVIAASETAAATDDAGG